MEGKKRKKETKTKTTKQKEGRDSLLLLDAKEKTKHDFKPYASTSIIFQRILNKLAVSSHYLFLILNSYKKTI